MWVGGVVKGYMLLDCLIVGGRECKKVEMHAWLCCEINTSEARSGSLML